MQVWLGGCASVHACVCVCVFSCVCWQCYCKALCTPNFVEDGHSINPLYYYNYCNKVPVIVKHVASNG